MAIFPRETWVSQYQHVSILDFIGAKGDGGGGDKWSCKTCTAPVRLSPPANQHPVFYRPDAVPVAQPTVSSSPPVTLIILLVLCLAAILSGRPAVVRSCAASDQQCKAFSPRNNG